MNDNQAKNILGTDLQSCCIDPMTGYFRDGFCNTNKMDQGSHTICAIMTEEFLEFSKNSGNDLSTPRPEFDFPGLKAGDGWCVCALRWLEAAEAGITAPVKPASTHEKALEYVPLELLQSCYIQ